MAPRGAGVPQFSRRESLVEICRHCVELHSSKAHKKRFRSISCSLLIGIGLFVEEESSNSFRDKHLSLFLFETQPNPNFTPIDLFEYSTLLTTSKKHSKLANKRLLTSTGRAIETCEGKRRTKWQSRRHLLSSFVPRRLKRSKIDCSARALDS